MTHTMKPPEQRTKEFKQLENNLNLAKQFEQLSEQLGQLGEQTKQSQH